MAVTSKNPLRASSDDGQSVWLDYIRRSLIMRGELRRLIEDDGWFLVVLSHGSSHLSLVPELIDFALRRDRDVLDLDADLVLRLSQLVEGIDHGAVRSRGFRLDDDRLARVALQLRLQVVEDRVESHRVVVDDVGTVRLDVDENGFFLLYDRRIVLILGQGEIEPARGGERRGDHEVDD